MSPQISSQIHNHKSTTTNPSLQIHNHKPPFSKMAPTIVNFAGSDRRSPGLIAELERLTGDDMPGLKSCRKSFGSSESFKDSRILICGEKTPDSIRVVQTLSDLGAEVKRCWFLNSSELAFKVENNWKRLAEALDCVPHFIVDFGGMATRLINEGYKAEEKFKNTGILPSLFETLYGYILPFTDLDFELLKMLAVIYLGLKANPQRYHEISNKLVGVCEMTTEGAKKAYQMQANGTLLFPIINVKGSIVKSKFEDLEGLGQVTCDLLSGQQAHYAPQLISDHVIPSQNTSLSDFRNSLYNRGLSDVSNFNGHDLLNETIWNSNINHHLPLPDGFMIEGKTVLICGYGSKGRRAAAAIKQAGAHVIVTEVDSCRAYRARMEGFEVCHQEDVVQTADIIITATGKKGTIMVSDMAKMKDNTLVVDIGHLDNEVDMAGLGAYPGAQKIPIRHGYICFFPETKKGIRVLLLPDREPTSYTNTMGVIGLLALQGTKGIGKFKNEVYVLSKDYDEMVAALHLEQHGAKLTKGSTSYITGSASCTTVALDGQEYLRKRKASLMNRLALPEMKFKCA